MRYAWKVSRLRHLIFDTGRPIVLGGRAMAMDRHNKRIRGKVVSASPKLVVMKTGRSTRRLSRVVWTVAPIEGETTLLEYGAGSPQVSRQVSRPSLPGSVRVPTEKT